MAKATPKRVNASVMKGLLPAMVVPQKTKEKQLMRQSRSTGIWRYSTIIEETKHVLEFLHTKQESDKQLYLIPDAVSLSPCPLHRAFDIDSHACIIDELNN
jgi:hypothetical protein